MATLEITRRIRCKVADAPCNPVALYWLNKNGDYDMWVFGMTQTKGLDVKDGESFERFIQDLVNTNKRSQIITKHTIPQIVLGYDNTPTEDVLGIQGLIDSVDVMMLVSAPTVRPPVFLKVQVEPGSFAVEETSQDFHSLELTINLPELFNQEL